MVFNLWVMHPGVMPLLNFKWAAYISCLASAKTSRRPPSHPALATVALTTSVKTSYVSHPGFRLQASQAIVLLVLGYWLAGEAGQCGYATPWIINYTGLTRASRRSYLPVSPRKFSSTQTWMYVYLQREIYIGSVLLCHQPGLPKLPPSVIRSLLWRE